MKISLICTLKNEEKAIEALLASIKSQTKMPNEIIFVDGGSEDNSVKIIKSWSKKLPNMKLIIDPTANISKGRNIAIENASHGIIVSVDVGCILDDKYIGKITAPLSKKDVYFTAGISVPKSRTQFEKTLAHFLHKEKIPKDYLPKGHAMAFKKSLWSELGGFREDLNAAEDTYFGKAAVAKGHKPVLVKDALVTWTTRSTFTELWNQFKKYGYYDAIAFGLLDLPRNSKLALVLCILFPLAFLHAVLKSVQITRKTKSIKSIYYAAAIDIVKLYSYSYGLVRGWMSR